MTCVCISDINSKLDGQEVETTFTISRDLKTMSVVTYAPLIRKDTGKREARRTKPALVAHKFCPFCGVQYHQDEAA